MASRDAPFIRVRSDDPIMEAPPSGTNFSDYGASQEDPGGDGDAAGRARAERSRRAFLAAQSQYKEHVFQVLSNQNAWRGPHLQDPMRLELAQVVTSLSVPFLDRRHKQRLGLRVDMARIQRAHLWYLRGKVLDLALTMQTADEAAGPETAEELGAALKEYVEAIRDLDTISSFDHAVHNPFIMTAQRGLDARVMDSLLGLRQTSVGDVQATLADKQDATPVPMGPWFHQLASHSRAQTPSSYQDVFSNLNVSQFARVRAALVASLFIIGPLWLLSLKQEIYLQLGVSTGCIALFGLLMTIYLSTPADVFSATIAYASVLMVFIGVVIGA